MIHAYAENYLSHARNNLGRMLDVGVNHLHCPLKEFYQRFLSTSLSRRFATGEPNALVGHSGIELAFEVLPEALLNDPARHRHMLLVEHSPEYWTGWALAYYQWRRSWSFQEIDGFAPIERVRELYHPYHEMDIMHFVEVLDGWYHAKCLETRLKTMRVSAHLSQSQLATTSGVPLRTIQQYEQRQKHINAARADAVLALAKALHCDPGQLLEPA